ncbi:hypothetical protein RYX36_016348, partial [Vicia faba]
GDFAGGGVEVDPDGEIAGVCEGGDKVGDFAGDDALEAVGDCTGETETVDGDFAGGRETGDLGEETGALSAQTKTEDVVKNIE